MSARKGKQTRNGVNCGGCGHFMVTDGYSGMYPAGDTPEDHIHHITHPPLAGASFMCAGCGHYTVVRDPDTGNRVIS